MPQLKGAAWSPAQIRARAGKIKLVLMDVDGVFTDGVINHFVDTAGGLVEFKGVNAHDSIALAWLAEYGFKTGCISGRNSAGMHERLKMLKASYIVQGRLDKKTALAEILAQAGASADELLYVGDDIPDIPVIKLAGIGVAVANARPEVKAAADWVTAARGGEGAIREVAELLLKVQGHWPGILKKFEAGSPEIARKSVQ